MDVCGCDERGVVEVGEGGDFEGDCEEKGGRGREEKL